MFAWVKFQLSSHNHILILNCHKEIEGVDINKLYKMLYLEIYEINTST